MLVMKNQSKYFVTFYIILLGLKFLFNWLKTHLLAYRMWIVTMVLINLNDLILLIMRR